VIFEVDDSCSSAAIVTTQPGGQITQIRHWLHRPVLLSAFGSALYSPESLKKLSEGRINVSEEPVSIVKLEE
jgi:hypothetical protein